MRFLDPIPDRPASDADADSPYVAALRPLAALAFAPTANIKTGPCKICGKPMYLYARREACIDCYPEFVRESQRKWRKKYRQARRTA